LLIRPCFASAFTEVPRASRGRTYINLGLSIPRTPPVLSPSSMVHKTGHSFNLLRVTGVTDQSLFSTVEVLMWSRSHVKAVPCRRDRAGLFKPTCLFTTHRSVRRMYMTAFTTHLDFQEPPPMLRRFTSLLIGGDLYSNTAAQPSYVGDPCSFGF
jgi:hypothetical protein